MEYSFAVRRSRAFSVSTATIAVIASVVPISAKKSAPATQANGEIVATGTMETRRSGPTATPLRNGDVLITGGMVRNGEFVAEAELFDPTTGKFSPSGRMASPRVGHTATLLPDGRVLIVGGSARPYRDVAQAEIYDPAAGKFADAGRTSEARLKLTNAIVRLPEGQVLIAGGAGHAEIFDPASLRFNAVAGPEMDGRYFSTAMLLSAGRVLLAGGYGENVEPSSNGAWIYVPSVKSVESSS